MTDFQRKSWFGPKRIGWGIRPQTWQGWLIVGLAAAFAALLAYAIR